MHATTMELYAQLTKNNHGLVSAMVEKEWLRMNGKLIEDRSVKTINAIYELAPPLREMFPADTIAPFYFEGVTASINSFTAAPKTCSF